MLCRIVSIRYLSLLLRSMFSCCARVKARAAYLDYRLRLLQQHERLVVGLASDVVERAVVELVQHDGHLVCAGVKSTRRYLPRDRVPC